MDASSTEDAMLNKPLHRFTVRVESEISSDTNSKDLLEETILFWGVIQRVNAAGV